MRLPHLLTLTFLIAHPVVLFGQNVAPGQELPGSFQAYTVSGEFAGRFHCPVCANGLRPGVLIFVRDIPATDKALVKLLKGFDDIATARPILLASGMAVFLGDGRYKELLESKVDDKAKVVELPLTKAIQAKEEKLAQLGALAKEADLKRIDVAFAAPESVPGYPLPKEEGLTIMAYARCKVLVNRTIAKNQWNDEMAASVLKEVTAALDQASRAKLGGR